MKKLTKTLRGLLAILRNPYLLNLVLNADEVRRQNVERLENGLYSKGLPLLRLTQLMQRLGRTDLPLVTPFAFLDGGSLPTDIALLRLLAEHLGAEASYFEIGTWRGESAAAVAPLLKSVHTLCLTDEEMRQLGCSEAYIGLHGFFSKSIANITQLKGDSITYNYAGLNQRFDLIFIDGNHQYDFVKADTESVFKHLIHDNTIVVWHDYAHEPESVRYEVFQGILDALTPAQRARLVHVSNTKCAVYLPPSWGDLKVLNMETLENPSVPTIAFNVKLESYSIKH